MGKDGVATDPIVKRSNISFPLTIPLLCIDLYSGDYYLSVYQSKPSLQTVRMTIELCGVAWQVRDAYFRAGGNRKYTCD